MAADEIEIPGTFRTHWPGSSYAHELASAADSLLTVWLRPKADGELDVARAFALGSTLPGARAYAERKELRIGTEADPAATERLTAYLRQFGIRIVGACLFSRMPRGSSFAIARRAFTCGATSRH